MLGWLLSIIPDSIFIIIYYLLLGAGISLYVVSKLVTWIPMMGQYKLPAELVGVIALVAGAFLMGGYGIQSVWKDQVAELQAKVKAAEEKSQQVNTVIETKYINRVKVVKEVQIKIQKEIVEVAAKIDADCKVDVEAINILNKAAEMTKEPAK